MLVDRGCVEGVQVIERAILDRIAQGGDRAAFARSEMATRPGWSYRSHWWVPPEPGRLCALGVFGQRVLVDAPSRLAVVRFGSHPTASNAATDEIHDRALDAIRAYVAMQRP
jgi:CubicO group peptidase (beta-lactamase class C family)